MPRVSPLRSVLALLGVAVGVGLLLGLVRSRNRKKKDGTKEVARRRDGLCAAMLTGDAAGAADCYADRARVVTRGGAVLEGRAAVAERTARDLSAGRFAVAETMGVVRIGDGDVVFESGDYVFRFESRDGKAQDVDGHYVAVWRRSDGAWRIALESAGATSRDPRLRRPSGQNS